MRVRCYESRNPARIISVAQRSLVGADLSPSEEIELLGWKGALGIRRAGRFGGLMGKAAASFADGIAYRILTGGSNAEATNPTP